MKQEQILQIQMMEQEANQLNEHLKILDENLTEMGELRESLEEVEKDDCREILANLGKRIYLPVEIKDKKLIVDVGEKRFIRKSIPETKKILEEQIGKLSSAKDKIMEELDKLNQRLSQLMVEIQKEQEKEKGKRK